MGKYISGGYISSETKGSSSCWKLEHYYVWKDGVFIGKAVVALKLLSGVMENVVGHGGFLESLQIHTH